MQAQILQGVPVSGVLPEVQFYQSGTPIWIEFTDALCERWVACFSSGSMGRSKVLVPSKGSACFVLAGGIGYWVDINERRILEEIEWGYIEDAVLIPDCSFVLFSDGTNLELSSSSGSVWRSKRISLDGIEFTSISSEQILGTVFDGGNVRPSFSFHIKDCTLNCEWVCPY